MDKRRQDDTWKPNRHHSNMLRSFAIIRLETQLPWSLHLRILLPRLSMGAWDSHLPAVPHTEDAEEQGRRVVLEMSELSNVYSSHHDDPSGATESPDAAAEAANPSSKGCRHLLVKSWANGTGKANTCSKSIQRKLVTDEGKRHSSRTVEERTELDMVQDEIDEAKRLLYRQPRTK